MMRSSRFSLFQTLALLAVCSFLRLQPGGAQQPSPPTNPLEPLAWLVGGTWTTEERSASGRPLVVRLNCRWSATKSAILYDVDFLSAGRETPQYDGMYVWHPGKGKIVLWQVNRKGEVAEGELTLNGKEMDQTVHVSHPDGTAHFLKAHYTRLDDNSFRFKAWFRVSESDPWQDAVDLVYRREPKS
jgi:hypothetical protein